MGRCVMVYMCYISASLNHQPYTSAMYVRDFFNCIELSDCDDKVECLWVKMGGKANKPDILLGVSYRPLNQD